MQIEEHVRELVESKIADRPDLFVIAVNMHKSGLLSILLDGDHGVPIADCAAVSRHVGFQLEEGNCIEHAYRLEVSSPGIDMPLQIKRQYVKNIGRNVRVVSKENTTKEGRLQTVDDQSITIEEIIKIKGKKAEKVLTTLPFEDINETKVLISFK